MVCSSFDATRPRYASAFAWRFRIISSAFFRLVSRSASVSAVT